MSVKTSIAPPHALATHPVKEAQHALDAAVVKAGIGKGVEALGAMQLTSLAAFHELAGLPHGRYPVARQVRPQPQPQPNTAAPGPRLGAPERSAGRQRGAAALQPSSGSKAEQDDDNVLGKVAGDILKRLRNGDHSGLGQSFNEQHDPLERYRILQEALKKLDDEAQSDEDKAPPRRQILGLLNDLDKEHGPAIREGLEATGDMHALLQSLGEASVNAVRGWFGTPRTGNTFGPLNAIDLASRLRDTFGAGNFSDALTQLGQKITKNLSVRSQRVAGEPPLMALSDTRAFTTVRSCHAKARELMRELGEINVIVRDRQGAVDVAITLMKMASGGKEQALHLTSSIVDWQALSERRQSRFWKSLRKTMSDLPASLWPQDASVKAAVLGDFADRFKELDANLPQVAANPVRKTEIELREKNMARMEKTGAGSKA